MGEPTGTRDCGGSRRTSELHIPAYLGTRTGYLGKQSGVPGQPWERSDRVSGEG